MLLLAAFIRVFFHFIVVRSYFFSMEKCSLNNKPICSKIATCSLSFSLSLFVCVCGFISWNFALCVYVRYHLSYKLSISYTLWLSCDVPQRVYYYTLFISVVAFISLQLPKKVIHRFFCCGPFHPPLCFSGSQQSPLH